MINLCSGNSKTEIVASNSWQIYGKLSVGHKISPLVKFSSSTFFKATLIFSPGLAYGNLLSSEL